MPERGLRGHPLPAEQLGNMKPGGFTESKLAGLGCCCLAGAMSTASAMRERGRGRTLQRRFMGAELTVALLMNAKINVALPTQETPNFPTASSREWVFGIPKI